MTPEDSAELDALLNRLVDTEAPAAVDIARLAELLRDDAAARRRYRHFMALHGALAWDYASVAREAPAAPARNRLSPGRWIAAAGFAALLAAGWLVQRISTSAGTLAVVESVSGSISWSDAAMPRPRAVATGAALGSGLLTADGENAAVQLRLADGTRVWLSGESELALSAETATGSVIGLRRGNLDAVADSRPGSPPASIRTGMAEISVPATGGTVSITADLARTNVAVEAGHARVRRLVDGTTLELDRNQSAIVTLDIRAPLAAVPDNDHPPLLWRRAFDRPPPAGSKGEWRSRDEPGGPCVRAVPYVAGRRPDGSPVIHHGITARPADGSGALASLTPSTVLRVRWRTARPASLQVFTSLKTADGAFGGNFELIARAERSPSDAAGWRTSTVRLADFEPRAGKFASPPPGALVGLLLLSTRETAADLEIAELVLDSTDA